MKHNVLADGHSVPHGVEATEMEHKGGEEDANIDTVLVLYVQFLSIKFMNEVDKTEQVLNDQQTHRFEEIIGLVCWKESVLLLHIFAQRVESGAKEVQVHVSL